MLAAGEAQHVAQPVEALQALLAEDAGDLEDPWLLLDCCTVERLFL